jgi:ubiquinone/menaquinone biosynthesis C-methylase UbiE
MPMGNKKGFMMQECPVCESSCIGGDEGDYFQCPKCESYVYVSNRSAELDNRNFYDDIYGDDFGFRKSRVKSKIFRFFQKKDRIRNAVEYDKHLEMRKEIISTLRKSGKSVEIGFGEGRMLESLLKEGVDIQGVDISEKVVDLFRRKHSEFRDRVTVGSRLDRQVDAVYCSALLEHLDQPGKFIGDLSSNLKQGGVMIIDNLPVLNPKESNLLIEHDICFWKPCHRVIYSCRGLEDLFQRLGYSMEQSATVDHFNYRVLSLHIRKGFSEIVRLRAPCLSGRQLPGYLRFMVMCNEALGIKSRALAGSFIFRKRA